MSLLLLLFSLHIVRFSSKVKWFYDCESPNASISVATIPPPDEDDKLEPINQNLERLQNDLFEQYDANVTPNDLKSFTIELTQSHFYPTKSLMTLHGKFRSVKKKIKRSFDAFCVQIKMQL